MVRRLLSAIGACALLLTILAPASAAPPALSGSPRSGARLTLPWTSGASASDAAPHVQRACPPDAGSGAPRNGQAGSDCEAGGAGGHGPVRQPAAPMLPSVALRAAPRAGPVLSLTVDTTTDLNAAGGGLCPSLPSTTTCSLREAIATADANANPADTITVPAGTYKLTIASVQTCVAKANCLDPESGALKVLTPMTITGAGTASTIVDGGCTVGAPGTVPTGCTDRVIEVAAAVNGTSPVTLSDFTIQHGAPVAASDFPGGNHQGTGGGGIYLRVPGATIPAPASLTNLVITNNASGSLPEGGNGTPGSPLRGLGGGLWAFTTPTTLTNVTLSDNTGSGGGGALFGGGHPDTASVSSSTVSGNVVYGNGGGGLSAGGGGSLTLMNTTVTNNSTPTGTAGGSGAGISVNNAATSLSVTASDISNNTAGFEGGGIEYVPSGSGTAALTITSSLISQNTAADDNGGGVYFNAAGGTLAISSSTFSGNKTLASNHDGGAIRVWHAASVSIRTSTFTSNSSQEGGALRLDTGPATIDSSLFQSNQAKGSATAADDLAGAIDWVGLSGGLVLSNSTLANNSSTGPTGGLLVYKGAKATLVNDTFTGNTGGSGPGAGAGGTGGGHGVGGGGGLSAGPGSTVSLTNVSIDGNSAPVGAGIENHGATVTLQASLDANPAGGADCGSSNASGSIGSSGYNLVDDASCNLSGTGDLQSTTPQLAPLGPNNGPTIGAPGATSILQTQALASDSPALDHFPTNVCQTAFQSLGVPLTDERGVSRPQGSACDSGAFEGSLRLGDVNGDGTVDATDALCVLRLVASLPSTQACPVPEPNPAKIATDGNPTLDATDALCILRGVAHLPNTGACPAIVAPIANRTGSGSGGGSGGAVLGSDARPAGHAAPALQPTGSAPVHLNARAAGTSFTLTADTGGAGLGSWTIEATYDPAAMTVTDCTGENGSLCNAAVAPGVVRIVGASASGLKGKQTLAEISFARGGKSIHAKTPTLKVETLTDPEGSPLASR